MSGIPKSTISKRGSASSFRTRKAKRDADEGEECCVCFQNPSDADAPCCRWKHFPCCSHRTCELCFARLEECPICRTGKDGTPGIERQQAREAADAAARAASAETHPTVIVFQSGGGGHPFSETGTLFRVAGLPPALMQHMPEILAAGMDFERARGRRAGRPLSHGERQQRAARIMRIEDLIGRRVNQ